MQINDQSELESDIDGEVTMINIFTPKSGQMDAFVAAQMNEYRRLDGKVEGWLGNHLHQSVDGKAAVNIATFATMAHYREWRDSAAFTEHLGYIQQYVESAEPMLFGPALYSASPG